MMDTSQEAKHNMHEWQNILPNRSTWRTGKIRVSELPHKGTTYQNGISQQSPKNLYSRFRITDYSSNSLNILQYRTNSSYLMKQCNIVLRISTWKLNLSSSPKCIINFGTGTKCSEKCSSPQKSQLMPPLYQLFSHLWCGAAKQKKKQGNRFINFIFQSGQR